MTQQPIATVEAVTLQQRIIWGALTLSQVLIAVVVQFAARGDAQGPGQTPTHLEVPLGIAAAALAFIASSYRRRAHSDGQLRKLGELVQSAPHQARLGQLLGGLSTSLIVSLALNESVVLLGFVLSVTQRDPSRILPFVAVGLVLNALAFPRPERLLARVRELVPALGALALLLALTAACSFTGGDYTPLKKDPETPCSREAEAICKEKLGSADIGNCVAREKYRCELLEQEEQKKPESSE